MKTVPVHYHGVTVDLPDLPEYRKFYEKLESGRWESHTFHALKENLDDKTVYIDIGGWIGVTALWASRFAKRVIIVEPDPRCAEMLRKLCANSPGITIFERALSLHRSVTLHAVDGFGSSETTALAIGEEETREVFGISVAEIMAYAEGECVFVKIDVEGYEYRIAGEIARFADYDLRGMQCAIHPQLYEQSLKGPLPVRRLLTLLATWRFARLHRGLSAAPPGTKYVSMLSYLLFGLLFRAVPKGTDLMLSPRRRPTR